MANLLLNQKKVDFEGQLNYTVRRPLFLEELEYDVPALRFTSRFSDELDEASLQRMAQPDDIIYLAGDLFDHPWVKLREAQRHYGRGVSHALAARSHQMAGFLNSLFLVREAQTQKEKNRNLLQSKLDKLAQFFRTPDQLRFIDSRRSTPSKAVRWAYVVQPGRLSVTKH